MKRRASTIIAMSPKPQHFDLDATLRAMEDLRNLIALGAPGRVSAAKRNALRQAAAQLIEGLGNLTIGLDPVQQPPRVLDPSDPYTVGTVIATALLQQRRAPLGSVERFYGSGVYAIYYLGEFPTYASVAATETPLYVGKADPADHSAETPEAQGERLSGRLRDHKRSVRNAENLNIEDFECRYLVVKSAWQGTAETYLIERFKPVWNNEIGICFGFGKHGDSSSTRKNTRSPWDTLHPGRPWAMTENTVLNELSPEQITERIIKHYREHPPEPRS